MILLSRMGYLRALILAGLLGLPQIANPQTPDLSPKGQEVFSRGLVAAQQQDWKLAIRYFLDAHKADPDAPQIWFNLGLASSKLPGYEFRAIAWFKAFLLASPNASNAAVIRSQITQLEVVFESRLNRLIDPLEAVAKSFVDLEATQINEYQPKDRKTVQKLYESSRGRLGGLLAALRLYLGDLKGAEKTRALFGIARGQTITYLLPKHFVRALGSAALYDDIARLREQKTTMEGATEGFSIIGAKDIIAIIPYALERGDTARAREMVGVYMGLPEYTLPVACKEYELGHIEEAKRLTSYRGPTVIDYASFRANCSGWWLNVGDRAGLLARGREGQVMIVRGRDDLPKFDETQLNEYFEAIKVSLGPKPGFITAIDIGNTGALGPPLTSLADLFESYRQMRGHTAEPRSDPMSPRRTGGLIGTPIVLGFLGIPKTGNTQSADLSPKAQEAFSRGLAAAQQQEWRVAIRDFLEAHKADPDAPQIWFNLGLASSQLPGRELRAIAWLKAYQEAVPNVPNAKALAELLAGLGARFEGNIGRLTEQLVPAARALSERSKTRVRTESDLARWKLYPGQFGDTLELPYATFLLVRDEASANAVTPRQKPTGIIEREGTIMDFYSHYTGAVSRAGKLEIAVAAAQASPATASTMVDEIVEYLLEQSRLDDAVRILRPFLDKKYTPTYYVSGSAVKIACKAREAGRTELVSQMFSAVKDEALTLKTGPYNYTSFALWLGQAEEIDRSHGLWGGSSYTREDVGKLPPHCRKVWWLKGERRAYLLDLATNGITIEIGVLRFDETRFKELTEAAKQIKDQDDSAAAMTKLLTVLANSAYAYRNINP